MKKLSIVSTIIIATAIGSSAYAQQAAPPGAGDKDLGDKNIKTRSMELERVDRDAKKTNTSPEKAATTAEEDRLAAKYPEIKADYEQIQKSQDLIVQTYQGTGKIDYAQIGKSALEINSSAKRLNTNLFPVPTVEEVEGKNEAKKVEKPENAAKSAKSARDLIVELDNAIGSFATSPMFQNLRAVDAAVSAKAKTELEKIIELSAMLNAEAMRMSGGK